MIFNIIFVLPSSCERRVLNKKLQVFNFVDFICKAVYFALVNENFILKLLYKIGVEMYC